MKKTLIPAFAILLVGCSSTPTAKWNATTATKTCFDAATKGKYDLDAPQLKGI